jgi:uncharacterized protein YprB with RNaseH-like and TPR domain
MRKHKILFYDVECAANEMRGFGHYDVSPIRITRYSELLTVAVKERHSAPRVFSRKHYKKVNGDKALCVVLYNELCTADLIVAHNLKRFDHLVLNARLSKHGLPGVPNATVIDTLEVARKYFKYPGGNSLKELARFFNVAAKASTSPDLWNKCMDSEPGAFTEMAKYNGQDTIVLEAIFNKLISYAQNIPDLSLLNPHYEQGKRCPNPLCLSTNVHKRGLQVTARARKQRMQCLDCGHWFTKRVVK